MSVERPHEDRLGTGGSVGEVLTHTGTGVASWTAASGGAPTGADYLVGTTQGGLSAEIVVGATPGGELGGTWASPTVDATHSGSAHHAESHTARHASGGADPLKLDDLAAPDDNTDLNSTTSQHGLLAKLGGGSTNFLRADGTWAAPSGSGAPASVDYLVGTADGGLSNEIVVGTTPGGELGGTWASPTVDAVHSGSAHGKPPLIGCMAYHSTTQSFVDAALTFMLMDSDEYDYSTQPMHFTSAANLTGTVAKTAASAGLVGTGTSFTTELSVGQVISVPGTADEWRVVTAITNNTNLTVNTVFANTASGQTATRRNSAIIAPVAGYYRINGGIWYATTSGSDYVIFQQNHTAYAAGPRGSRTFLNGAGSGIFFASPPILLAQWDFIEMVGYHTQAGTLATGDVGTTPSQQNYLAMQLVGT